MKQAYQDVLDFNVLAGRPTPKDPMVPKPDLETERLLRSDAATLAEIAERWKAHGRWREACGIPGDAVLALRVQLVAEEFGETLEAMADADEARVADGIGDLIYVAIDAAVALGIELPPVWQAIAHANLEKFPHCPSCGGSGRHLGLESCEVCKGRGRVVYFENGKVVKPPGWAPPDIVGVLRRQRERNAPKPFVHILFHGRALCGDLPGTRAPGLPSGWSAGDRWVGMEEHTSCTCSWCLQLFEYQLLVAAADLGSRR